MINIQTFTFGYFGVNTYVLWNADTLEAVVIDPGMINAREYGEFDSFIADNSLKIGRIINTHMHIDHIFADNYVAKKYGVKKVGAEADLFLARQAPMQARMFMLPVSLDPVDIDEFVADGDVIDICGEPVTVLAVPGHSPGSVALYFGESQRVFTGDVLFSGAIGRTDLVGGNMAVLMRSLREKLMTLPSVTTVYPGHGEPTTIGAEAASNPYL